MIISKQTKMLNHVAEDIIEEDGANAR